MRTHEEYIHQGLGDGQGFYKARWLAGSKHTQTRGWGQLVGVNTMALVTIRWGEIPLRDRSGDAEETTG